MNEKYLMVQKFWENITNGCTPRGQNRPPMGSLWYPFTSSFSIFWCGSIMFFHATLSHHFGSSSDQIRSMCIALSCVYEWMQVRVKERSTHREKGRKWKGWVRAHALWKTKIQLYLFPSFREIWKYKNQYKTVVWNTFCVLYHILKKSYQCWNKMLKWIYYLYLVPFPDLIDTHTVFLV